MAWNVTKKISQIHISTSSSQEVRSAGQSRTINILLVCVAGDGWCWWILLSKSGVDETR